MATLANIVRSQLKGIVAKELTGAARSRVIINTLHAAVNQFGVGVSSIDVLKQLRSRGVKIATGSFYTYSRSVKETVNEYGPNAGYTPDKPYNFKRLPTAPFVNARYKYYYQVFVDVSDYETGGWVSKPFWYGANDKLDRTDVATKFYYEHGSMFEAGTIDWSTLNVGKAYQRTIKRK